MSPDGGLAYEADDRPPVPVSLGVGFQGAVLALAPPVTCVVLLSQSGHLPDGWLVWAVFATLMVNGIVGVLQASRLGAGTMFISGTATGFLPVSVIALAHGGPVLLASLVVAASVFQFGIASWLPRLRRIITPTVSGLMIMLIAVATLPIALEGVGHTPAGAPRLAAPASALATLAVAFGMGLRATGKWRLWSPVAAILAGSAVAAALGAYDAGRVHEAPWVGVPAPELPDLQLPGPAFWPLLPVFLLVSLSAAVKTLGAGVLMQRVSTNSPAAPDYRVVQRAVRGNALGSLLCGAAGVLPIMSYEAISASLANLTGAAARRIGYYAAAITALLACLPKLTALLLTIPAPVFGAYLLVIMGQLLVEGMKTIVQDGLDARKSLIVAVALALGVGMETRAVFADLGSGPWGALLNNGITVGAIAAIAMTAFMELTNARPRRLQVDLAEGSLARLDDFLRALAADRGWTAESCDRLRSVGEEAFQSLLRDTAAGDRSLTVVARPGPGEVELEFLAALSEVNVEDEIAYLGEAAETLDLNETSLRLLRHYATSVRHRKYHGVDVVGVRVEGLR